MGIREIGIVESVIGRIREFTETHTETEGRSTTPITTVLSCGHRLLTTLVSLM